MKELTQNKLAISTVWKSGTLKSGQHLIENLTNLGLNTFELEYRISSETFEGIKLALKTNKELRICSVHNYFPIPQGQPRGGGDFFLLSSDNYEERTLAVKYTVHTMEIAAELGASTVVVHLGRVPMESVKQELFRLYDNRIIATREHEEVLRRLRERRENSKGKTFESLLLSVESLVKAAEVIGVNVGIENRYYFREYPNFDELDMIFKKFGDKHIGYWHDIGHSKVQENLGIIGQNQLLKAYGSNLIGIHLHDVRGYLDHCVPGSGEVDFKFLKQFLKPDTLKILEIHPREGEKDLLNSIRFLESIGIN